MNHFTEEDYYKRQSKRYSESPHKVTDVEGAGIRFLYILTNLILYVKPGPDYRQDGMNKECYQGESAESIVSIPIFDSTEPFIYGTPESE